YERARADYGKRGRTRRYSDGRKREPVCDSQWSSDLRRGRKAAARDGNARQGIELRLRRSGSGNPLRHVGRYGLQAADGREGRVLKDERRYPKRPLVGVGAIIL